jgi:hypothetical protein
LFSKKESRGKTKELEESYYYREKMYTPGVSVRVLSEFCPPGFGAAFFMAKVNEGRIIHYRNSQTCKLIKWKYHYNEGKNS